MAVIVTNVYKSYGDRGVEYSAHIVDGNKRHLAEIFGIRSIERFALDIAEREGKLNGKSLGSFRLNNAKPMADKETKPLDANEFGGLYCLLHKYREERHAVNQ